MESTLILPRDRARARRRRMQVLQAMLHLLAKPLLLARDAWRRTRRSAASEKMHHVIAFLVRELTSAAQVLAKRLNAFGVRESRRSLWKKAAAHLRIARSNATGWSHHLITACRNCASRLCGLFRTAQAMADRAASRVAYGVLRTLEKELWLLQSN